MKGEPVTDLDSVRQRSREQLPIPWRAPAAALADTAAALATELAATRAELTQTRAEAESLRRRVAELQTWIDDAARFDAIEHLQLGRLLALQRSERRLHRHGAGVPLGAIALILYATAALALALLVVTGRL